MRVPSTSYAVGGTSPRAYRGNEGCEFIFVVVVCVCGGSGVGQALRRASGADDMSVSVSEQG